jgi:hypothetical protein
MDGCRRATADDPVFEGLVFFKVRTVPTPHHHTDPEVTMIRLTRIVAPVVFVCALAAAPAEGQVTSVSDLLNQESLREAVQAQQDREVRRILAPRAAQAPAAVPNPAAQRLLFASAAPLTPLARNLELQRQERMQQRHTRISRTLLAAGAGALVAGFADYVGRDGALGMTWTQGALMGTGFGLTVVGTQSWDRAAPPCRGRTNPEPPLATQTAAR